jgi:integrase
MQCTLARIVCKRQSTAAGIPPFPEAGAFLDDDGHQPGESRLAELLRRDSKAAGVDRPELFERTANRLPVRAHDLRASFITVALANDKSEKWITDRTGPTTSSQLRNYHRAARFVAELELGDFAPFGWLRRAPRSARRAPPAPRTPRRSTRRERPWAPRCRLAGART